VFFAVSSLFTCITPMLLGRLYDLTGSYQPMLWICGLCFVIGPLLLLLLGPYPQLREESMAADETAERSAAGA
jgi:cyanate permease